MNFRHLLLSIYLLLLAELTTAATLDDALQSALQKNETAAQAQERVIQTRELVRQAKAVVLPSLSANAIHQIQPELEDIEARKLSPANQTSTALTLNQPLFRGFREFATMRQRENVLSAEKQNRLATLVSLYEQVASSYLQVLAYEQDLVNVTEQRKLSSERVKELKARISRGESNANEALTAQATDAAIDGEIQILQANLKTARENFFFLTGLPENSALADQEVNFKLRPLEEYLGRIEERPDYKSAKDLAAASKEGVSIAKGGHWPSADLIGNYYFQRPESIPEEQKWDVQFRLSFPIFEGGLRMAQVREAASKNRETELGLKQLERRASADIRSLYQSVKMRADQLKALKLAAELSEKSYQVLQRDYRRGLSRNIDVQMAMSEFRMTKRNYDQARYLARLDLIRLETAAAILPPSLMKEM